MRRIEDILDQAVNRVKNGEEISTVLLSYPREMRDQLSANLNLVKLGLSLPKVAIPIPTKRMLFLDATPQSKASRFSEFLNVWAIALTVVVLVIGATSLTAAYSLPGDRLFSLKRGFEETRLKLARNPEEQAKLQLTFANARLEEANQILAEKNLSQADAAISELNSQTEQALQNIQQIAATNPNVKKDPTIINSVKSLADNQAQLVNKVAQTTKADPQADPQIQASTQKTVANIQKLIAASNEQSSADLPTSAQVTTDGQVTLITDKSITVDKNSFDINSDTVIQDKDGNAIAASEISLNDTVHVEGQTKDQSNLAQKIVLISKAPVEKSKDQTPTEPQPDQISPTSDNDQNQTPTANPQDTFGGFIPEAPVNPIPAN